MFAYVIYTAVYAAVITVISQGEAMQNVKMSLRMWF